MENRVYGNGVKRSRPGKNYVENEHDGVIGSVKLSICIVLIIVMLGLKLTFPQVINKSGERILEVLSTDADFKSAMTCLGETISGREDISKGVVQAAAFILGTYEDGTGEVVADEDSAEGNSTSKNDDGKDGINAKRDNVEGKYSVVLPEEKNAEYV